MDLKTYVKSLPVGERDDFALAVGTTPGHLRNIMYGCSLASPAIAVAIERLSGGRVTRLQLRPDDALAIWPDLAGQAQALQKVENNTVSLSPHLAPAGVSKCRMTLQVVSGAEALAPAGPVPSHPTHDQESSHAR